MSLLDTKVLPTLKGKYEAKVLSYKQYQNDQGGYIRVELQLPDRVYPYCVFPTQVEYVASALRNQFGKQEDLVTLKEMLEMAKKTKFSVWFSYNPEYNRMNVALHEPRSIEEEVEL